MSRLWLVAALLGVGLAEALKRVLKRAGRREDLPLVGAGILGAVVLSHLVERAFNPAAEITSVLPDIVAGIIILLCVIVRFWR